MDHKRLSELRRRAAAANRANDFEDSGIAYTLSAYTSLGLGDLETLDQMASGVHYLFRAALSFRLAGAEKRAKNRTEQGLLIVDDIRTHVVRDRIEHGICYELEGDLRTIAELNGADGAYSSACEIYEEYEARTDIDEIVGQMAERSLQENTELLRELISVTDFELSEQRKTRIEFQSPVARVEFKRRSFNSIVEDFIDRGEWLSVLDEQ